MNYELDPGDLYPREYDAPDYDADAEYAEQLEHERMCAEYDEMIYRGCRDE